MSKDLKNNGLDAADRLLSELTAIEYWDAEYWKNHCPEFYEKVAFEARQERRSEIIRQLSALRESTS